VRIAGVKRTKYATIPVGCVKRPSTSLLELQGRWLSAAAPEKWKIGHARRRLVVTAPPRSTARSISNLLAGYKVIDLESPESPQWPMADKPGLEVHVSRGVGLSPGDRQSAKDTSFRIDSAPDRAVFMRRRVNYTID